MAKKYQDRAMGAPEVEREFVPASNQHFFPKADGGPVVVVAETKEEAEAQLQDRQLTN